MQRLAPLALLLLPTPSTAQSVEQPVVPEVDRPQVQEAEKDLGGALFLELLVPVLGHAYAGDARRGVLPAVVTLGGVGMIFGGASARDYAGVIVALGGIAVSAGGKIWGLVSAVDTARDYNRRLRERASPTLVLTRDGRASIGVSLRFQLR